MIRLTRIALLLFTALALAGCGGAKPAADSATKAPPAGGAAADPKPAPETDDTEASPDNATGGTGHTHQEGTLASSEETVTITGDKPSYPATTHDGWTVEVTSTPAAPAVGRVTWEVEAHGPGHAEVTPGQLLMEPEGQETGTGKKLALEVTQGEPGHATVVFPVEVAGTYEVEFHLHRSDGGDSHVKYVFTVP